MNSLDYRLLASFAFASLFAIGAPIALILWLKRRLGTRVGVFALGALAFALSQLFTRVPIVAVLANTWKDAIKASETFQWLWLVGLALTAGLFEETARWLCFRFGLKGESNWKNAVSLGAGHGGLESAVLIGVAVLGSAVSYVMIMGGMLPTEKMTPEQLQALEATKEIFLKLRWWEPLLGAFERAVALTVHIALSVVVLRAFLRKQWGWYLLAVLFHALSNFVAVAVMQRWGAVAAEAALLPFGLVALWLIFRLRDASQPAAPSNPPLQPGVSA